MALKYTDFNGHDVPDLNGVQLTAGAVSTTAVGTIAGTTSAGAAPTVAIVDANDRRGHFTLSPVTGGGAQAAGNTCKVFFAQPYAKAPAAVLATIINTTDTTAPVTISANNVTVTGFDLVTTVLVTAKAYDVFYQVIP
jgi:hypothetical protein